MRVLGLLIFVLMTGCGENFVEPTAVPAGIDDPAWASIDDEWSDLARTVPGGFAGFTLESNALIVLLVDTTKKQGALDALGGSFPDAPYSSIRVRAARWNFFQLAEWYRFFQVGLRTTATITLTDIDEGANRITFGVHDAASRAALEQSLAQLDVPCYLVGIRIVNFSF
jgi:hypothetical protein